jgi:hypothetical protein
MAKEEMDLEDIDYGQDFNNHLAQSSLPLTAVRSIRRL